MNKTDTPPFLPAPANPRAALGLVMAALDRLTPGELARLDAHITPEAAALLVKAFGPGMGVMLWPLIAGDQTAPEHG